jgi:hypothetical protein
VTAARRCAILLLLLPAAHAADVAVLGGPWSPLVGAGHIQGGAGGDFASPVFDDVLIAVLSISNTGGAGWTLYVAREGNEALWPTSLSLSLKRGGGGGEAGISDGLTYRALTPGPQPFFAGAGDYAAVEIFARLEGVSVSLPPQYPSLRIRYALVVP